MKLSDTTELVMFLGQHYGTDLGKYIYSDAERIKIDL